MKLSIPTSDHPSGDSVAGEDLVSPSTPPAHREQRSCIQQVKARLDPRAERRLASRHVANGSLSTGYCF